MDISSDELIARINELAHKDKAVGLSISEEAERRSLREEYIRRYRENLRSQLDSIRVVEPNGDSHKLKRKK